MTDDRRLCVGPSPMNNNRNAVNDPAGPIRGVDSCAAGFSRLGRNPQARVTTRWMVTLLRNGSGRLAAA